MNFDGVAAAGTEDTPPAASVTTAIAPAVPISMPGPHRACVLPAFSSPVSFEGAELLLDLFCFGRGSRGFGGRGGAAHFGFLSGG